MRARLKERDSGSLGSGENASSDPRNTLSGLHGNLCASPELDVMITEAALSLSGV